MNTLHVLCRVLPGLLLMLAGAAKYADVGKFSSLLTKQYWIPASSAIYVAAVLPAIEAGLGLCIVLNVGSPWSSLGAITLLAIFGLGLLARLVTGNTSGDCGCGLVSSDEGISWLTVVRPFTLVGLLTVNATPVDVLSGRSRVAAAAALLTLFATLMFLPLIKTLNERRTGVGTVTV